MAPTGMYRATLKEWKAKNRQTISLAQRNLERLNNQGSDYANEHRALLSILERVRAIYAAAPDDLPTMAVCIVCMDEEITRLRKLAQASLDARDKEARAAMSLENAQANFHRFDAEERAHAKAMIEASEADRALREALRTHNAALTGAHSEEPTERR